ncbi:MAG TPA: tetratricopeptide repeat protein [Thermoanaerobaculia bacterium]|jgi:Flp pilus assembly protein TadD
MIAAGLAIAVLVIYAQVVNHDFVNFDDPDYVVTNPHVATGLTGANVAWAFSHAYMSNWHPLTWISHMVDVSLFGMNGGRHALVSVIWHAINSVLLFFVLRRATQRLWPSAVVAALFALHPLHVESVAWISERKDVLSAFFFLLALWFYLTRVIPSAARDPLRQRDGDPSPSARLGMTLTFAAFACALMAKPMAITFPFVLLLLDWWPLGRWSPREWPKLKPLLVEKIPLFVLIPISAIVTRLAQEEAVTPLALPFRLANAALSYVAYLWKTIWPVELAIFYPYRTNMSSALALVAAVFLIAVTWLVLRVRDRFPYLAVGWLWYAGMLVPVIGIVQVGQQSMADRYTYLPLIGIFIAVVWLALDLIPDRPSLAVAAAVVVAACAFLTFKQLGYWRDSFALFSHAAEVEPRGRVPHQNLGAAYLTKLDYTSAANQFRQVIALNDGDDNAHVGLGIALAGLGDRAGARREYEKGMALNPNNAEAYRNLGRLELAEGNREAALQHLQKAAAMKPNDATLAALAAARGDDADAIRRYREAAEKNPNDAEVRNDLGALLARKGGSDAEALQQYEAALRQSPDNYDAHMNLGALLSRMDRNDEAAKHFASAAQLRPKLSEPHVYLAILYANMGRFADAAKEVRAAGAIDPAGANQQFTNAVRIPFKETNLQEYLGFLEQKAAGRG